MSDEISRDRVAFSFAGPGAGAGPLTWGQRAIWQDMADSGSQFNMFGRLELPDGGTVADAADRLAALIGRHAALRMRLRFDGAGRPFQEIAGAGKAELEIHDLPDDAGREGAARYAAELMESWPERRFDFERDWPLRMALIRHRGECLSVVWVLSHLAADGGALLLLAAELAAGGGALPERHLLDLAAAEQAAGARQASERAMRYWESALAGLPARTFGEPAVPAGAAGPRFRHARFRSSAADLALRVIAARTGTDLSRATLAVVATAIGRVTGVSPLPVKVMVSNRFRPGMAGVIAPIAQNSLVVVDVGAGSIDEVVARTRGAAMTASMRAYYDPADLAAVHSRLAAGGGPVAVTCRVNDQRAMLAREREEPAPDRVSLARLAELERETALSWLGPTGNTHEQVSLLIENRPDLIGGRRDVLALHLMWDSWSLTGAQAEAILRGTERVAVEAALDPAAR